MKYEKGELITGAGEELKYNNVAYWGDDSLIKKLNN